MMRDESTVAKIYADQQVLEAKARPVEVIKVGWQLRCGAAVQPAAWLASLPAWRRAHPIALPLDWRARVR
jgi:hypothetical protein